MCLLIDRDSEVLKLRLQMHLHNTNHKTDYKLYLCRNIKTSVDINYGWNIKRTIRRLLGGLESGFCSREANGIDISARHDL